MTSPDTIVAISTPTAPAHRIILRISGAKSFELLNSLSPLAASRINRSSASFTQITFNNLTIDTWLYTFISPHSYTGEDSIELHLPGNPLLAQMLLDDLMKKGARLAQPGEFTARAYFNAKLNLTEAEAVASIVSASNESELRAARQLLSGELSRRLAPITDSVTHALALLEAALDFSDEDISFISTEELLKRINSAIADLETLTRESERFEKLSHEPTAVLVGRPNAGKSSLLNALAGRTRAVVSPTAGTTRDALSAEIALPQGMIRLIDVAGVEQQTPSPGTSGEGHSIDRQMHTRALQTLEQGDLILLCHDITDNQGLLSLPRAPDLIIFTKSDLRKPLPTLPSAGEGRGEGEALESPTISPSPKTQPPLPSRGEGGGEGGIPKIAVSSLTLENLDQLKQSLSHLAFTQSNPSLALNTRHLTLIASAQSSLTTARTLATTNHLELIAANLRHSLDSLGEITGIITPDDVLGKIFSQFCIGK